MIGSLGYLFCFLCTLDASILHWDDRLRRSDDDPKLRLVHVLFRHGDRSQIRPYTGDIYTEADWPQGYGQLSTTGMQQAYELGLFFQQRYVNTGFLDAAYNRTQIHVRSTTYDRTLMTAYSMLAGLFPPTGDQLWKKELPWQPIPVHTKPKEEDRMLVLDSACPAYDKSADSFRQSSPIFTESVKKYQDVYDYISSKTGEPATWDGIGDVLDPIFCQYMNNFTMPDWVTDEILDKIFELRDVYAGAKVPPDYAYLKGGMLLREMFDHMQNVSGGGETISQKMFFYSAHDTTVQLLLLTLGVFNHRQPPYTGCVIVELFEQASGTFTVHMSYRNDSEADPYPLQLQGCEMDCPLEKFAQIMQYSMPVDIEHACGLTPDSTVYPKPPSGATIAVAILTGALLLVMLIGGILCCVKRNKLQDNHDYKLVPMEMD